MWPNEYRLLPMKVLAVYLISTCHVTLHSVIIWIKKVYKRLNNVHAAIKWNIKSVLRYRYNVEGCSDNSSCSMWSNNKLTKIIFNFYIIIWIENIIIPSKKRCDCSNIMFSRRVRKVEEFCARSKNLLKLFKNDNFHIT